MTIGLQSAVADDPLKSFYDSLSDFELQEAPQMNEPMDSHPNPASTGHHPNQDTAMSYVPKSNAGRQWTTESLNQLSQCMLREEEKILSKFDEQIFDDARKENLTVDVSAKKHADFVIAALNDVVINPKPIIAFDNDLWTKIEVTRQADAKKIYSNLCTVGYKQKEAFKKVAKPRTSDFAIEMVNKMTENWKDIQKERNALIINIARLDNAVREKNKAMWVSFLKDVKQGDEDVFVAN